MKEVEHHIGPAWTGCSGKHFQTDITRFWQAVSWCRETIGTMNYQRVDDKFYFKRPQDAMLFVLRWGK